MKYFVAITLLAAAATAALIQPTPAQEAPMNVEEIIAAIQHPGTNPATAAALEQMLLESLGLGETPVAVGPAIIETPISVGPAIVAPGESPISVGPAIVAPEESPISVGPAIIDFEPVSVPVISPIRPPTNPTPIIEEAVIPVVVAEPAVVPEPAVVAEAASSPLVQIILNINQASSGAVEAPVLPGAVAEPVVEQPIAVSPVAVVEQPIAVSPVAVVESAPTPVTVVESAPTPVTVVDSAPTPVTVVDSVPTPVVVVDSAPTPVAVVEAAPAPVIEPVLVAAPVIVPGPAVTLPEILN